MRSQFTCSELRQCHNSCLGGRIPCGQPALSDTCAGSINFQVLVRRDHLAQDTCRGAEPLTRSRSLPAEAQLPVIARPAMLLVFIMLPALPRPFMARAACLMPWNTPCSTLVFTENYQAQKQNEGVVVVIAPWQGETVRLRDTYWQG